MVSSCYWEKYIFLNNHRYIRKIRMLGKLYSRNFHLTGSYRYVCQCKSMVSWGTGFLKNNNKLQLSNNEPVMSLSLPRTFHFVAPPVRRTYGDGAQHSLLITFIFPGTQKMPYEENYLGRKLWKEGRFKSATVEFHENVFLLLLLFAYMRY